MFPALQGNLLALVGIMASYLHPGLVGQFPAELVEQVEKLLEEAERGSHVQCMDRLMTLLRSHSLVYTTKISPAFVHVHPENRDGVGANAVEIHSLLSDIGSAGFCAKECSPVCVEVPHDDTKVREFNHELFEKSGGLLAPVEGGTVKYASLSCTHTNGVLRLFHYQQRHADQSWTLNGALSLDLLKQKDPDFHAACTEGLTWDVISASVCARFPQLPSLMQQSRNTAGQLMRGESELQLCRRIHSICKAQKTVSFEEVKNRIMRTKPMCADSLPSIFKFLAEFGGDWILQTEACAKACKPKTLGASFWEALSTNLPVRAPLRHWCLRLAYTSPEKFVMTSDVKKLFSTSGLKTLQQVERVNEEVENWLQANQLLTNSKILLGEFQQSLIAIAMKKSHPLVTSCTSMEECAGYFVDSCKAANGLHAAVNPWEAHVAPEDASAAPAAAADAAAASSASTVWPSL